MERIAYLKFSEKEYKIRVDILTKVADKFVKYLPITSVANNIGGEIYFRVPGVDIEYDGTQYDKFEIGDVVYWRSPVGEKIFSIAMFYGNTKYSDWKTPKASSPCVKIGKIENVEGMESIQSGENVNIAIH